MKGILVILWVAGVVLAEGWWKLLAFFIPFYGFYLIVELGLRKMGWL